MNHLVFLIFCIIGELKAAPLWRDILVEAGKFSAFIELMGVSVIVMVVAGLFLCCLIRWKNTMDREKSEREALIAEREEAAAEEEWARHIDAMMRNYEPARPTVRQVIPGSLPPSAPIRIIRPSLIVHGDD